jgi:hypothetical protein
MSMTENFLDADPAISSSTDGVLDEEILVLRDVRAHDITADPERTVDLTESPVHPNVMPGMVGMKRPLSSNPTYKEEEANPERPQKVAKAEPPPADVPSECSVCLEPYASSGERRCVVTKCGHLFCYTCIETVRSSGKPCPKCRQRLGKKADIRNLYDGVKIVAVDNSVVDLARKETEDERARRVKVNLIIFINICHILCFDNIKSMSTNHNHALHQHDHHYSFIRMPLFNTCQLEYTWRFRHPFLLKMALPSRVVTVRTYRLYFRCLPSSVYRRMRL